MYYGTGVGKHYLYSPSGRLTTLAAVIFATAGIYVALFWQTTAVTGQHSQELNVSGDEPTAGRVGAVGDCGLDPTFGAGGRVTTDVNGGIDLAAGIVRQVDGKFVVAGGLGGFKLARYNTDGSVDTAFGTGGKVVTTLNSDDSAYSLVLQSDGKIVAAGKTLVSGRYKFALVRYNTNGSLDTTFGSSGKVVTDFFGLHSTAFAVALQSDGKIVAAGFAQPSSNTFVFAVARYTTAGQLDSTFDGDGRATTVVGSGSGIIDEAFAVVIQSNGRIVLAGETSPSFAMGDTALVRYNSNGSLDTTFGSGGKVISNFVAVYESASAAELQTDGKIVIAGEGGDQTAIVARYNTDGTPDNTFNGNGVELYSFGSLKSTASDLAIQPDGSIVIAGSASDGSVSSFGLARFLTNGTPDNTFASAGGTIVSFANSSAAAGGLVVQPDGKVVAAGRSGASIGSSDLALARYIPTSSCAVSPTPTPTPSPTPTATATPSPVPAGTPVSCLSSAALDTTFNGTGKVQIAQFDTGSNRAYDVVTQPDGKIIVTGNASTQSGTSPAFAVARLNLDGSFDSSFDGDGKVIVDVGGLSSTHQNAVALQPDGKIVIAGESNTAPFTVVRLNANGSLDTTFDGDGKVFANFGPLTGGTATGVAIQPDGKIVVTGQATASSQIGLGVMRFNSNGSLDASFDGDGRLIILDHNIDIRAAVAMQRDGKIVIGAPVDPEGSPLNFRFGLYRFNANGSLDTTFGTNGIVVSIPGYSRSLAIQADGKILAGGISDLTATGDFEMARYNPDGSLDTTFDDDGVVVTPLSSGRESILDMVVQPDGKIVAAGFTTPDFAVVRYNPGGSIDSSLGPCPATITDFGDSDVANGVALEPDGRIVAVGTTSLSNGTARMDIARYGTAKSNAAPVAVADTYVAQPAPTPFVFVPAPGVIANDTDADGNALTMVLVTPPSLAASYAFAANGSFAIDYPTGFSGTDSFTYRVSDGLTLSNVATVTINVVTNPAPTGLEGDVAPRPSGDGKVQSDDVVQVQRFQIGLDAVVAGSDEFLRADSAPFSSRGNGRIQSDDVVQTQRYQIGLDPLQTFGARLVNGASATRNDNEMTITDTLLAGGPDTKSGRVARRLRLENTAAPSRPEMTVYIMANAVGDESAYGFTLNYDVGRFNSPIISLGNAGGSPMCSAPAAGRVICSITGFADDRPGSSTGEIGEIHAGRDRLLVAITFTVLSEFADGHIALSLTDVNVANDSATSLPIETTTEF